MDWVIHKHVLSYIPLRYPLSINCALGNHGLINQRFICEYLAAIDTRHLKLYNLKHDYVQPMALEIYHGNCPAQMSAYEMNIGF